MKKELDSWSLCEKNENCEHALSRFLITLEELRVRLAPSRYPNIEITDEGYLWFNIDTSTGTVEILAFPFGFKEIDSPSIAVSLPRKAEKVNLSLLEKLRQTADNIGGGRVIAKQSAESSEILHAFERNEHPQLTFVSDVDEISEMRREGVFFSYLGVLFPVTENTLSDGERRIKKLLLELEQP